MPGAAACRRRARCGGSISSLFGSQECRRARGARSRAPRSAPANAPAIAPGRPGCDHGDSSGVQGTRCAVHRIGPAKLPGRPPGALAFMSRILARMSRVASREGWRGLGRRPDDPGEPRQRSAAYLRWLPPKGRYRPCGCARRRGARRLLEVVPRHLPWRLKTAATTARSRPSPAIQPAQAGITCRSPESEKDAGSPPARV
jgi:hypothetical protein